MNFARLRLAARSAAGDRPLRSMNFARLRLAARSAAGDRPLRLQT
jgi:hypothetical protein